MNVFKPEILQNLANVLKFSCEIASYRDGGLSGKISNWMVAVKDGV